MQQTGGRQKKLRNGLQLLVEKRQKTHTVKGEANDLCQAILVKLQILQIPLEWICKRGHLLLLLVSWTLVLLLCLCVCSQLTFTFNRTEDGLEGRGYGGMGPFNQ